MMVMTRWGSADTNPTWERQRHRRVPRFNIHYISLNCVFPFENTRLRSLFKENNKHAYDSEVLHFSYNLRKCAHMLRRRLGTNARLTPPTHLVFCCIWLFCSVWACRCKFLFHLADLEAENLLEVCGLADEEQVEGPASAKVGHDDGVHWHWGEEMTPRCFEFLQQAQRPELDHSLWHVPHGASKWNAAK